MMRLYMIAMRLWAWLSTGVCLAAVLILLGFLLSRGAGVLNTQLLFGTVAPLDALTGRVPVWDGLWPALVGTLVLVLLAGAFAVPVGTGCGIYLAEYARGRTKRLIDGSVDLLAGVPSVLMGLFGFMAIVFVRRTVAPQANTGLLVAAICLALLVLPYLVSATRAALEGLPASLRLTCSSLGLTRWQSIAHVLLPAASRSIAGGVVLALGRAAEDTAVILLTGVVANAGLPRSLGDKFEALPFAIYSIAAEHQTQAELERGFGAALLLLALTSALLAGAQILHRSLERKWAISRWPG